MNNPLYGPNGAQCVECANWLQGCEQLDFSRMRVIRFYPEDNFKMVVCTNYVKYPPALDNKQIS